MGRNIFKVFIAGIVVGAILLAAGLHLLGSRAAAWPDLSAPRRSEHESRIIQTYKTVNEAVVFISTITLTVDPFEFFPEITPREGSGSGVIVDAQKGIILTNLHVIKDANQIEIIHSNGQSYKAKLLGYDEEYDVAVLQFHNPPPNLIAIQFGDSSKLDVGQDVLAIGNPFGLNRTLTSGIISSLGRTVKTPGGSLMKGLIQTDAAINPGNSGGALLDTDGRLIGINTAILSQSGESAGIGFAIPVNLIKRVLPELIATGKVLRPFFGWVIVDTTHGPMVRRTQKNGPADKAGIQPLERRVENGFVHGYVRDFDQADLIFSVNGKRALNREQLEDLLSSIDPEKGAAITLRRGGIDGKERSVTVYPSLK